MISRARTGMVVSLLALFLISCGGGGYNSSGGGGGGGTAPAAPAGLAAAVGNRQITLPWNAINGATVITSSAVRWPAGLIRKSLRRPRTAIPTRL
jgi:hypothetical protein